MTEREFGAIGYDEGCRGAASTAPGVDTTSQKGDAMANDSAPLDADDPDRCPAHSGRGQCTRDIGHTDDPGEEEVRWGDAHSDAWGNHWADPT